MPKTLSDYLNEIADSVASFDQQILSHLCRMAALEAKKSDPPLRMKGQIIGIWDWDVVNDRNHLDPNCARLFGVTPDAAAKGLPNSEYLNAVHPEDRTPLMHAISDACKGGPFSAEYRIITESQTTRVLAKGFCTLDRSNRPERFPGAIVELGPPQLGI